MRTLWTKWGGTWRHAREDWCSWRYILSKPAVVASPALHSIWSLWFDFIGMLNKAGRESQTETQISAWAWNRQTQQTGDVWTQTGHKRRQQTLTHPLKTHWVHLLIHFLTVQLPQTSYYHGAGLYSYPWIPGRNAFCFVILARITGHSTLFSPFYSSCHSNSSPLFFCEWQEGKVWTAVSYLHFFESAFSIRPT